MSVVELSEDEAEELAESLCGIVSDYPMDDPRVTLQGCADRLAAGPGGPERDGLVIILNATAWYAASGRIGASEVLQDMAAALGAALATLDPDACDGGHPHVDSASWDLGSAVSVGAQLLTEKGRRLYDPDEHELPLEAWRCPKALAALATEAVEALSDRLRKMRGEGITDGLDERYVAPDGRVDVPLLARTAHAKWQNPDASPAAGLWAAHRIVSGTADTPEDRLGLLLSLALCVSAWYDGLVDPYLPAMEAAIATIDLTPGETDCPHGDTPHPWSTTQHRDRLSAVTALFGPKAPSAEWFALWSCPRNLSDLADECLTSFKNWRTMRMCD